MYYKACRTVCWCSACGRPQRSRKKDWYPSCCPSCGSYEFTSKNPFSAEYEELLALEELPL